jgi:hypothetical protein
MTAFLLFAVGSPGAAARADGTVTMRVSYEPAPNDVVVFDFAGTVSGAGRGESVDVLGRGCGVSDFRLLAGARTRAGGNWRVSYPPEPHRPWRYPPIQSGTTLHARWDGRLSAPYVYRAEAPITVNAVPGRLARSVHVSPPPPGTVSMRGKVVLLQRLRGHSWVTIRSARLVHKPSYERGALNHEAVFPVQYGWTLRVVLPAKSAAPCYRKTVTERFRVWT